MCDPVTATIAIASAATSYMGQKQAADAQSAANEQARSLAIQNQNLQIRALRNQEDEDRVSSTNAMRKSQMEAEKVAARARVASGESGVSGLSIDALLGDVDMQLTDNLNTIRTTQGFRQRQRQLDREGLGITTQSQINRLPAVQYPSLLETAANAGMSYMSMGGSFGSGGTSYNSATGSAGASKSYFPKTGETVTWY